MSFDGFFLFGETAFDVFVLRFAVTLLVFRIHTDSFLAVENFYSVMVGAIKNALVGYPREMMDHVIAINNPATVVD